MSELYIVFYEAGAYEDHYQESIFATKDIEFAKKYVNKFNAILSKWQEYYEGLEDKYGYLQEKYDRHYLRWKQIKEIYRADYYKLEYRE